MKYIEEVKQFNIAGKPISAERYGEGHINETHLIISDKGAKYILQKINSRIFKDIPALMNNIQLVTARTQFKLVSDMENLLNDMKKVIKIIGDGN